MRDDIKNKLLEWKRTKSITLSYEICEELAKEME